MHDGTLGWRYGLVLATALVLAVAQAFATIAVAWESFGRAILASAGLLLLGWIYTAWRPNPRIAATSQAAAQILLFSAFAATINYLAFDLHRPLIDAPLAAFDRAIGFDWRAYIGWIERTPHLGAILNGAYALLMPEMILVIIVLGLSGRLQDLGRFCLAFMISAWIVIGFWAFFPSFGIVPLLYSQDASGLGSPFIMSESYARALLELHHGPVPDIRLHELIGVIGFPSFHTVTAILPVLALHRTPYARWLAAIFAVPVLLSVPAAGGHHLADMLGGAAAALVAWWLAVLLCVPSSDTAGVTDEPLIAIPGRVNGLPAEHPNRPT